MNYKVDINLNFFRRRIRRWYNGEGDGNGDVDDQKQKLKNVVQIVVK